MKLEFAFLADAVDIRNDGQFSVVGGGFDLLRARSFPAMKYAMALVGRVVFEPVEMDKNYLMLCEIIGPDGHDDSTCFILVDEAVLAPNWAEPFKLDDVLLQLSRSPIPDAWRLFSSLVYR